MGDFVSDFSGNSASLARLGMRLFLFRNRNGISDAALADRLGCYFRRISYMESGRFEPEEVSAVLSLMFLDEITGFCPYSSDELAQIKAISNEEFVIPRIQSASVGWTEDRLDVLRILWSRGISTAEIGRIMGVTKNAVVGRSHRLNLERRVSFSPGRNFSKDGVSKKLPASEKPVRKRRSPKKVPSEQISQIVSPEADQSEFLSPEPLNGRDSVSFVDGKEKQSGKEVVSDQTVFPVRANGLKSAFVSKETNPAARTISDSESKIQEDGPAVSQDVQRDLVPDKRREESTGVLRLMREKGQKISSSGLVTPSFSRIRECAYPVSDDRPWVFCKAHVLAGSSYCPEHHAICYVPISERFGRKF